ncbi:DUF4136 domain-containing protein [Polaromonas jejuensis]|uniref:DUF4136 domain-containing protein n=1 Tax=Polaromonas jejuensis TaxID=457502 RepID=A0ABW0QJI1_9BURK|nr:DUF4136 domain-containing protein [Polaromonas jejuensis]
MKRALSAIFLIAFTAFFMAGCSGVRLVDSDVTAFPRWSAAPPGPGTAYRFERLPSQQAVGAQQDQVEGLSRSALAKVGMELNPPLARYSVQVLLNTQRVVRLPYDGWGGPGVFLAGGNRGASLGLSFPLGVSEPDYFKRELSILMRDVATQQVVFETRALHDGVWSDTLAVLPAMLDAALRGFPQPPPGTRRINVEIPR